MPPSQDLFPYLEDCHSSVAYPARNLELDSSLLNLCWGDLLWTKTNLFVLGLASRDAANVLISAGSCPQVSRSCPALCSC